MYLGKTLLKLKAEQKKTQQQIADSLGVSRQTYASWEKDEADVKSRYIPKLAEIFNVDISVLLKHQSADSSRQRAFDKEDIENCIHCSAFKDDVVFLKGIIDSQRKDVERLQTIIESFLISNK